MEVGRIPAGAPGAFGPLLLPRAEAALAQGEPILALGLTDGPVAAGALAGAVEDEWFQVHSLYVAPDFRRRGGGRLLLDHLAAVLAGFVRGIEVNFTATRPEHDGLPPFLTATGFSRRAYGGAHLFALPVKEVWDAPFFREKSHIIGTPFRALGDGTLSLLEKAAHVADAPVPRGGLQGAAVDRDISLAYLHQGEATAYVVFCRQGEALTLDGAWSGSAGPAVLAGLLRSAADLARAKYPPDTLLIVQAVNEASAALFHTLLPHARPISHTWVRELPEP